MRLLARNGWGRICQGGNLLEEPVGSPTSRVLAFPGKGCPRSGSFFLGEAEWASLELPPFPAELACRPPHPEPRARFVGLVYSLGFLRRKEGLNWPGRVSGGLGSTRAEAPPPCSSHPLPAPSSPPPAFPGGV